MIPVPSIRRHDLKLQIGYSRTDIFSRSFQRYSRICRLGRVVIQDFTKLRMDSQAKNIAAWTPVVAETLQGFVKFDDKAVCAHSTQDAKG